MLALRNNRVFLWAALLLLAAVPLLFLHHHDDGDEALHCVCQFVSTIFCLFCVLFLLFSSPGKTWIFQAAVEQTLPFRAYAAFRNRAPPRFLRS